MKVFELIENNEWSNQKITLDHLNKAQKAACYQFWVYLTQLKKKYPELYLPWWMNLTNSSNIFLRSSLSLLSWQSTITNPSLMPNEEKMKFKSKYDHMIKAKEAYEAAGGDYKEKLKESDDEFESQKITLDHLYKVYKAACYQLELYLMQLKKKYPVISSLPWWNLSLFEKSLLRLSQLSLVSLSSLLSTVPFTNQEKAKYEFKYNNIIKAKKAYEKAGGKVDNLS